MKTLIKSALIATSCALAMSANAGPTWEFSRSAGNFGGTAGATYDNIHTVFEEGDSAGNIDFFSWEVDNARNSSDQLMDGFWLVINDGPNPKQSDVNELAIFYADFNNDTLHAYAYNGLNNSNSWNSPGILIGDYSSGLTEDGNTLGFTIDASAINDFTHPDVVDANWGGAQFDDSIGIWFHPVWGLTSSIDSSGALTSFSYASQGWYDVSNRTANQVPEPGTIALLAAGLIGLRFARKNKA